jgi:hypothetical protein
MPNNSPPRVQQPLGDEIIIGAFIGGTLTFTTFALLIAYNYFINKEFESSASQYYCRDATATLCIATVKAFRLLEATALGAVAGSAVGVFFKPAEVRIEPLAAIPAANLPAGLRHR